MSLNSLNLSQNIVKSLVDIDYTEFTAIQKELIPAILQKQDVMAGASTGTGKTAAFSLPILEALSQEFKDDKHYPKALIIAPTRELVSQIEQHILQYSKRLPLKSTSLYGGSNFTAQSNRLSQGVDIIVSTSGRLLEHIEKGSVNLTGIKYFVLDEADTMLDMGFVHELSKVVNTLPVKRQTILVSATLNGRVKKLASTLMKKPKLIQLDNMKKISNLVTQYVYPVMSQKKIELLSYLIGSKNYKRVLVFVRKKEVANLVVEELNLSGLKSELIHGDKTSGHRKRAIESFLNGKIEVLVATDIAARGIDIPSLDVVVSFDIPHVISDYIHRVGRTGRAGREGLAITLVDETEVVALRDVEKLLGTKIEQVKLDEYAPIIENKKMGARSTSVKQKTAGAFGKKKKTSSTFSNTKKRKTTKRDGFKVFDASKPDNKKSKRRK